MAKKMTKREYDAWRSQHAGKDQYEIYHKEAGEAVVDFSFWAASRAAAVEELELFRQKQRLVSPSDETEYFYREINSHVVVQKDGTYLVSSGLREMLYFGEDETVWEKVKGFFELVSWKIRDLKYMLYDVAFWLKHYNIRTNHGEERADCWSVNDTVLRKILFNVPRMMESLHGCPSKYVAEAVVESRARKGQTITIEQAYRIQSDDEEMAAAVAAWKADLEKLLLYIRLYQYYEAGGIVDAGDGPDMAKIAEEYRGTLPIMPGTDGEVDYAECEKLTQKYWELYCDHWKAIGRMCWD